MNCPKCGKSMIPGFQQTTRMLAFNKGKRKLFLNPQDEDDIMLSRKAFDGTDYPAYRCKECGLIVFDYTQGTNRF